MREDWLRILDRYRILLYFYMLAPVIAGAILAIALFELFPFELALAAALVVSVGFFVLGMPAMLRVLDRAKPPETNESESVQNKE